MLVTVGQLLTNFIPYHEGCCHNCRFLPKFSQMFVGLFTSNLPFFSVTYSHDGQRLFASLEDGTVHQYEKQGQTKNKFKFTPIL